jgi:hypothetical protein
MQTSQDWAGEAEHLLSRLADRGCFNISCYNDIGVIEISTQSTRDAKR